MEDGERHTSYMGKQSGQIIALLVLAVRSVIDRRERKANPPPNSIEGCKCTVLHKAVSQIFKNISGTE